MDAVLRRARTATGAISRSLATDTGAGPDATDTHPGPDATDARAARPDATDARAARPSPAGAHARSLTAAAGAGPADLTLERRETNL